MIRAADMTLDELLHYWPLYGTPYDVIQWKYGRCRARVPVRLWLK